MIPSPSMPQRKSGSFFSTPLTAADSEIFAAIAGELHRQQHQIELIASETEKDCVAQFLTTAFEGGRHQRRVEKMGLMYG